MLRRREADLDSADTFLPLVMGALSLAQRIERLLETVPVAPEGPFSSGAPSSGEDDTTLLLLGVLALGRRLLAHVEAEVPREPDSLSRSPVRGSSISIVPHTLLR